MRPAPIVVVVLAAALGLGAAGACTNRAGGGPADVARGERYFKAKCNACHPNGGQGAGPALASKPVPGPLKKAGSGRHGVPEAEWDSLLLYVTPIMQPPAAAVPVAPVAQPGMPAAPAVAPAAGMKVCNCTCQCPIGTPPGQMANCTCSCACPP